MRALRLFATIVGGVTGLAALLFAFLQTPPGQRALAGLISNSTLQVSGISGFFPTDLDVARIDLVDGQGPWLRVENARLRWSFASLFAGRVRVEILSAGLVDVLRTPLPQRPKPATASGTFELPLGVDVQAFSVDALHLAAPLAGVESRWALHGNGLLPANLEEGRLRLSGVRTDGPTGKVAANIRFDLTQRTVDGEVTVEEGAGGVTAALLQRPDLPGVSLRLAAKGDAVSGSGELTLTAADAATAKGTARWQPNGGGTSVSVRLEAAGAQVVQRGGPVSLSADATVADTMVTLNDATLTAGPLRLSASGTYDRAADRLDGTAILRSDEPGPLAPLLGGATWRGLHLTSHAVLDGLARQPQGSVTVSGGADDLSVAALDGRLPALGKVALDTRLGVQRDGRLTLDALHATSALGSVTGNGGTYLPKTGNGDVKATIDLPRLAPFSALAGRELAGNAHLDLSARRDAGGVALEWQGSLANVGVPAVPADLIAPAIALSGKAMVRRDETWSLADVRVASDAGAFDLSGQGKGSTGKFELSVDLKQLAALGAGLAGAATATSTIELRADGTAGGSLAVKGDVQGRPVSLAGRFERDAAGGVVVPSVEGHWASAALNVADLAITPDRTSGSARLTVERLQDVSALLGMELAGAIDAEVTTDPQLASGRIQARISAVGLQSGAIRIAKLQVDGTIDDPMGKVATDARITATGLGGVADLGRASGTIKGDRQSGLDVALQASGASTNATLATKVDLLADETRVTLQRLEGRHQGIAVALNAPARLRVAGTRVRIDPATLRVGGGRLALQGVVDPVASDLRLDLTSLPLSLIDAFAPGTGLDGSLQARLHVAGPMANPSIDATYAASRVRLRRPEAALLPAFAVQGSAAVVGRQASIDARLSAATNSSLAVKGKVATAPLAGTIAVTGAIDLAPLAPLLGNRVRGITGTLRSNLAFDISSEKISATGSLDLQSGALNFPEMGLRLSGGTAHLAMQGDTLQLQKFSFQSGRNGALTASGTIRLDPVQGVALDLAVATRRALLVNRADLAATVSSDLKVTGSMAAGIDVTGPVTVDRAEISVGGAQTAAFPTVDVREINKPGVPNALPPARSARAPSQPPSAVPVRLALSVQAPQAVFVRGRGLDAEMSGTLQVTGDPAAPTVAGGFMLRRGDFTLGGRRLVFRRGIVSLDNLDRIDPSLDFVASATAGSTTIEIAITGTASAPAIAVTSVPAMPSDEALAMLLFGKPATNLSAFELVQVAQTLAELTGREAPATGLIGRLRRGLGIDRLSVGTSGGASGSSGSLPVGVEAGRYVAPGVYVGAKQGAAGNSSRGVVEIEVLDHTKIEGDIGADSNGRLGVKMEWDY